MDKAFMKDLIDPIISEQRQNETSRSLDEHLADR